MELYKIDAEIRNCMEEVDEETGELLNWERLDALTMAKDKKIEGIACWIKNLRAKSEALKHQKLSFKKRQKAAENKADQLENYLSKYLQEEKFETEKVAIWWRKSTSVEIEDVYQIDENYVTYETPKVDKKAIRKAIQNGVPINGVRLVEKKNIQIK